MAAGTVAGVYAQALLALAEERGSTMQVIEDCREALDGLSSALLSQLDDPRLGKLKAKEIVKFVKDSKKKVQASIMGDSVRIIGKDRDTLQDVIGVLRGHDFDVDLQFTNYRTS